MTSKIPTSASIKTQLRRLCGLTIAAAVTLHFSACATTSSKAPGRTAQATELLRQADKTHNDLPRKIGLSLSAAESALDLAADKSASQLDRTTATHLYNAAVAECVLALRKLDAKEAGTRTFPGTNTTYVLRVVTKGQPYLTNPANFNKLLDAGKIARKHLKSDIQRDGIGAPFVGVTNDPKKNIDHQPIGGFAQPITAIAKFGKPARGHTPADIFFYEAKMKDTVTLENTTFPLRGDFTAPLAYFPKIRPVIFGFVAMMRSDRVDKRSGIFLVEPYDPNKIPVLFVHGLMSSPQAWIDFINDLNADPNFRKRYQGLVYFYPSGGPIGANATRLRRDLAEFNQQHPLKRNLIIVGHSMGGLLTKMQITNSRRDLWNSIFGSHADKVYASLPPDSVFKEALIFEANPHVKRVIFFSTPHRGSKLADLRISSIVGSLIRMPVKLVKEFNPQTRSIINQIHPGIRSVPSSIVGLSPRNPLLKGMDKLTIVVPYHSVIGNQGRNQQPLAQTSDGVVPYGSSHLDGAQSELIVPTGHDSFDCPESVTELLRILKLDESN